MKQTVIQMMETMAVGLMVCFCIGILLAPNEGNEIWSMAAVVAKELSGQEVKSEHAARMGEIMRRDAPQIRMDRPRFQVGEDILFWDWLSVQTAESTEWIKAVEREDICPEILEVTNEAGVSLDTSIYQEEASQELEGPLHCDLRTGRIQFFKSGIYGLKVKVADAYGRVTIKQLRLPVEAG